MGLNRDQANFFEIGKKVREFRVLVFGPIPQGQNAELDFAELVCQHKKLFSR